MHNLDNSYFDWLFHQNVFPLRESTSLMSGNCKRFINPVRTGGGGGVFHQVRGLLPITLDVINVRSRNLVTFPKI